MPRRRLVAVLAATAAIATVGALTPASAKPGTDGPAPTVKAGVGVVDATWHVGASAGQYASSRAGLEDFDTDHPEQYRPRPEDLVNAEFDPQLQSTKRTPSYGVQSRLSIRAIVVEGGDGTRVAMVKNDNYLA